MISALADSHTKEAAAAARYFVFYALEVAFDWRQLKFYVRVDACFCVRAVGVYGMEWRERRTLVRYEREKNTCAHLAVSVVVKRAKRLI